MLASQRVSPGPLLCILAAGDRAGLSDEEGLENYSMVIKEAVKRAEDVNVTICVELLNSKGDHPAYMCDNSQRGFELCSRVLMISNAGRFARRKRM